MEKDLKIQIYLDYIRLFIKSKDSKNRDQAMEEMIVEIEKLIDLKTFSN